MPLVMKCHENPLSTHQFLQIKQLMDLKSMFRYDMGVPTKAYVCPRPILGQHFQDTSCSAVQGHWKGNTFNKNKNHQYFLLLLITTVIKSGHQKSCDHCRNIQGTVSKYSSPPQVILRSSWKPSFASKRGCSCIFNIFFMGYFET